MKPRVLQFLPVILSFWMLFLFASCRGDRNPLSAINIFPVEDDVKLGAQVVAQLKKDQKEFPVMKGERAERIKKHLMRNFVKPILKSSAIKHADIFPYSVEIIERDDIINAFALPGGPVYLYTGLLRYLDSETALAGVIAHEIAHIERRHASSRMTKQLGVQFVLGLVLGDNPSELEKMLTNLFVGSAFLANSRADEDEADALSFKYLQATKYYPGAVKFMFEQMVADGSVTKGGSRFQSFFSTHPQPQQRIALTDRRLKEAGINVVKYSSSTMSIPLYRESYKTNIALLLAKSGTKNIPNR